MTDPHTAAATLAGQAASVPAMTIVGAILGVPESLLAWGLFGALVALANSEPRLPPKEGWALALSVATSLVIGAGMGAAFASVGADVAAALATKAGFDLGPDTKARFLIPSAIAIGAGTGFLPELFRFGRRWLDHKGVQA